MNSAAVTTKTLELLWQNYLTLAENVDIEAMEPDTLAGYATKNIPMRPFWIAAWLGRQAFFMVAWSLWERYSRDLCHKLPVETARSKCDSHVDWVQASMEANSFYFTDYGWFRSANCLRNLLAHFGGRALESRPRKLLQRSHIAFPDLETYNDGYVKIDHCHVADLELKIEHFIKDMAQQGNAG